MATKWFGTMSFVRSNQKADIWHNTAPLSGTAVGSTTSKADIRSVATMRKCRSSSACVSLTLPRYTRLGRGDSFIATI